MRSWLAGLRLVLLLLVLWMLSGWSWLRFKSDQPELIVVLDRSASMSTRDTGDAGSDRQPSRLERAVDLFRNRSPREMRRLRQQYQWQWYTVGETLEPLADPGAAEPEAWPSLVADDPHSRLGDGLTRLIQRQTGKGTAAIIFLSDGINTSGAALSEAAKAARRAAIPILAVPLGRQMELPDVRLADLLVDRELYLGDQVAIEVNVIANDVPATETRITIRDMATERLLDETRVTLSAQQRQVAARLNFVPDQAGELRLRIEAAAVEGEKELDNNAVEASVQVHDKTIRVLLISEMPSYEFRFLKSFLERSMQAESPDTASFELHSVLQDADPLYVDQDATALRLVPSNSEAVAQYDTFVLMDVAPTLISQSSQQAMVEAVLQHGAGMIFVSGQGSPARRLEGWPLATLLPVERSSRVLGTTAASTSGQLRWQLTPLGSGALPLQLAGTLQENQAVWQRLPDFLSIGRIEQLKGGAQVLSQAVDRQSGDAAPVLITQFAGAGRSVLQATDETYRWSSFLGSDLYYQRYWGQMLRWLSRGKLTASEGQMELQVEPPQSDVGQAIRFQVTLGGPRSEAGQLGEVEVDIDSGGARLQTLRLPRVTQAANVYQATVQNLPPGNYRAALSQPLSDSPPSQEFSVTAPPGEQATLRANLEGMRQLAEQSRGKLFEEATAQRLFDQLPPGKPTRLGPLPSQPLWNAWWVAALFVGLITCEWILRRRCQML